MFKIVVSFLISCSGSWLFLVILILEVFRNILWDEETGVAMKVTRTVLATAHTSHGRHPTVGCT